MDDASSRRLRQAFYGDENAALPSKQASMAATNALQQARAMEAPKIHRRAPLQPLAQNIVPSNRSSSTKPTQATRSETAQTDEITDEIPTEDDMSASDATIDDEDLNEEELQEGPRPQIVNKPGAQAGAEPGAQTSAHTSTDTDADADADADEEEELLDSIVEDEGEFDDAQLLSHNHSHTASFADDETDENDEVKLRLAIMNQPKAACNPDALFPLESVSSRLMLDRCAQIVAATPGVLDAEDEDMWDASMVLEYSEDIFRHLRVMELRLLPDKGYMAQQKELNWTFRTVLIDWLVKIHFRFNLLPETLYLCVNYVDRFLSVKEVSLSRLQLVGAVALFIAAKFEEINYLSVQEVSQMVENVYSVEEILKAERYMIDLLDFNLGFPGPMSFLRRVSKADDYELETRTLAKYLLEVTMMDARFVAAPPSWCAAIAHYMSRHMLRQGSWTPRHIYFSTYTEQQLLPGVAAVREALNDPQMHHQAVFEKYSERKFRKAALFVRNWMQLAKERPEVDFSFR